ncbi:uncharacterized protein [Parasteatoda tepidariorum]|uniref:uncharacterized protein n=1 Tax=Parasteatoda tepidariorum TaxID=114398 RepID=UPI00077FE00F|nr:uncharacterized protein LOC107441227 [Parasteatoda tepidariorum]
MNCFSRKIGLFLGEIIYFTCAKKVIEMVNFFQISKVSILSVILVSLLLSSMHPQYQSVSALLHGNSGGGGSGIETLLAAGILAKLLGRRHHGHHSVPIHIPYPVHHDHGHHHHHGR